MNSLIQENVNQKNQETLIAKMITETFDWSQDHPLEFYEEKVPKAWKPYE